jgi:hypothetical protein
MFGSLLNIGCKDEEDDAGNDEVGDGDGDTGGPICSSYGNPTPCDCGEMAWPCQCYYSGEGYWGDASTCPLEHGVSYVCSADIEDAEDDCYNLCEPIAADSRIYTTTPIPCIIPMLQSLCTNWDPASEITYDSVQDVYSMSYGFLMGLAMDPAPLVACDSGVFLPLGGATGFELANTSSDEFFYEMGLRNGDEFLSLNGLPLNTYFDIGVAVVTLWGETSFTLEVKRGSTVLEFDYELIITL